MSREVVSVPPEASLKEVARLLTQHRISGMPVVDGGRVVGVVSEADILRREEGLVPGPSGLFGWLLEAADGEGSRLLARTAGDAMTRPAFTISPNASSAEAARLMIRRSINRLPVVVAGELVGIVTRADLVRVFDRPDEDIQRELVEEVLQRTLWIAPEDVRITVDDGRVHLAGRLDSRSEAELIAAYARRVPGVLDVESDLTWRFDDLARRVTTARLPHRI